ncbi:MAG: diacylglycerol kinase [Thiobacillus sp.]|nr:MAG: diacylglycerol kinase [Thiobacillus sp. SCN 63-374]OZA26810.1 MAG: diacylglycerol kinase [Hydrogenophilales bacterium 17-64-11]
MRNKFLGTGEPGYRPLRKLAVIAAGLRYAVLHDFSVMYKVVLSAGVLLVALWLRDWVDAAVILLATGLVVAAELFNTAIEALCDFVETRHNEKIGIIKDIAAAATGMVILAWWIVLALEAIRLWPRLMAALQGMQHAS